ncbi:MAG: hypothetical protein H0W02_20690 [Ktedonobacteraceae bacterium]|nr:hypothetical protein [Ktedonobacteraceae bacterium]
MSVSTQFWFLRRNTEPLRCTMLAIAACSMFGASLLPWLHDPLGNSYTPWSLPVDMGWQFRLGIGTYGLLCLCGALYLLLMAAAHWRPFWGSTFFARRYISAVLLCVAPIALFCVQYLLIDMQAIERLAQHETQWLLVANHFGYNSSVQLIALRPLSLDVSSLRDRLYLLLDCVLPGLLLPCASAWLVMSSRRFPVSHPFTVFTGGRRAAPWLAIAGLLALVVIAGRAPAGLACEYEAGRVAASGDYRLALNWLDAARTLNPTLDDTAYYHVARGEALYLLRGDTQSADSHAYLASSYMQHRNFLAAYQQMIALWHPGQVAPWITAETSIILENVTEAQRPLKARPAGQGTGDAAVLTWLQVLVRIDPANVYGHYLIGRIHYDLHDYTGCIRQMNTVMLLNASDDIQSSAYTYIALGEIGLGYDLDARALLLRAVALDPYYHNNTAREELSGLR